MNQLISVVVPVYNVSAYLEECIESLLAQTYLNIEIILVDDGSTDNSLEICNKYCEDARIKVIHQENQGVVSARKKGIENAKGKWIGFVDGDDWVEPNYFELLYRNVLNYDVDLAVCKKYTVKYSNMECGQLDEKTALRLLCEMQFPTSLWSGLFSREKVVSIQWEEEIQFFEDFLFMYKYLHLVEKVVICDVEGYHYRINTDSINHQGLNNKRMSCLKIIPLIDEEGVFYNEMLKQENIFAISHFIISILSLLEFDSIEYGKQIQSMCRKYAKRICSSNIIPLNYKLSVIICAFSIKLWCLANYVRKNNKGNHK